MQKHCRCSLTLTGRKTSRLNTESFCYRLLITVWFGEQNMGRKCLILTIFGFCCVLLFQPGCQQNTVATAKPKTPPQATVPTSTPTKAQGVSTDSKGPQITFEKLVHDFGSIGAKTKNEVFFEDRLKKCGATILVSTDDGSKGFKGSATDLTQDILKKENFDSVLTCGPEVMMKILLDYTTIPFQASLDRYMKCAIGLCGQCCIGEGLRVCIDGPIFDGKTLKNIQDFGIFRRDSAGRKVRF